MRPRHSAGEYPTAVVGQTEEDPCFNEAPAFSRGIQELVYAYAMWISPLQ